MGIALIATGFCLGILLILLGVWSGHLEFDENNVTLKW